MNYLVIIVMHAVCHLRYQGYQLALEGGEPEAHRRSCASVV